MPGLSGRRRPTTQLGVHVAEHNEFLDAFAEARRTWDDLVALQPDIAAASGQLDTADLVELARRVNAHRVTVDALADALHTVIA